MSELSLAALEARIGHRFQCRSLLEAALTHPSYGADHHAEHYQRLEFLGDAVLELAISRALFSRYKRLGEGQLTRLRANLVREETLCLIARDLNLGPLIRLSVGEEKSGGADKPSILSDVVEAVLAAVMLDAGEGAAFSLVERLYAGYWPDEGDTDALDAKSRLQERLQRRGVEPVYELISQGGPVHLPEFTMRVLVEGEPKGEGRGRSKRAAQQAAAREALRKIRE